ncbi:hypothetical protein [Escherichia coli]|nr:hypothetical protein [Escherichia coli]
MNSNYGGVLEVETKNDFIPAGDIFLRVGRYTGPNRGFGVNHILSTTDEK